jgi:hypothetical protein
MIQSKSKYKKFLVSGGSYTHNANSDPTISNSWANTLANWTGMEISNLSIPGSGFAHNAKSIILYLEQHKLDPEDVFIMVLWSQPEHIDWICDSEKSNFQKEYPFSYQYTKNTELVLGGNLERPGIQKKSLNETELRKTMLDYAKFQSEASYSLQAWLELTRLTDYLTNRGYTFLYTSAFSFLGNMPARESVIDFVNELSAMNLTIDKTHWLDVSDEDHIGAFCLNRGLFSNAHPTVKGHDTWTQEILLPYLNKKNILNDR